MYKYIIILFFITILVINNFNNLNYENFKNHIYWDEIYLLTIPRLKNRKNYMLNQFKKSNLNSNIYYGVDKNIIDNLFLNKLLNQGKITEKYYNNIKDKNKGSLACLLTHTNLWTKLKKNKNNNFLIFEDDCYILPDFKIKSKKYLEYVPNDWDMIWLGHNKLVGKNINDYILKPYKNCGSGCNALHHCYMIKKQSIDKLLNIIFPLDEMISKDSILRNNFDKFNAYFIIEPLTIQDRKTFKKSERLN